MKRATIILAFATAALVLLITTIPPNAATADSESVADVDRRLTVIEVPEIEMVGPYMEDTIFVSPYGKTKILLIAGEKLSVLDSNGTDGNGAKFCLPNLNANDGGETVYSVWVKFREIVGNPFSEEECAYFDGGFYCPTGNVLNIRNKGKGSLSNVTSQLMYVHFDIDGDGLAEKHSLFDPALEAYFWSYDDNGLKVAQYRFVEKTVTN